MIIYDTNTVDIEPGDEVELDRTEAEIDAICAEFTSRTVFPDRIEFYSDNTIKGWYDQFMNTSADIYILPGVPFGFYTIRAELVRRYNVKDILSESKEM